MSKIEELIEAAIQTKGPLWDGTRRLAAALKVARRGLVCEDRRIDHSLPKHVRTCLDDDPSDDTRWCCSCALNHEIDAIAEGD